MNIPYLSARAIRCLSTALALFCLAGFSFADTVLLIKNDTNDVVIVHVSTVIGGKVLKDPTVQVKPGKTMTTRLPGNKVIQIEDARSLKPLFNGVVPADKDDQHYLIMPDTASKVKLEKK